MVKIKIKSADVYLFRPSCLQKSHDIYQHTSGSHGGWTVQEALQNGQQKGGCLARPRHCRPTHVPPCERHWDYPGLWSVLVRVVVVVVDVV